VEAILAGGLRLALSRRALRVADDEKLVAEVRSGNRSAFEAVYDRHHAGILAFARHMLGSREESEDVVQHTFAAAYQAMLADDREIALKAWLYAIARNRCLSVLRARREHLQLDDAAPWAPATAGLSVEVEQREDLRALLADLQRLPEDQRAALILAELGAHSHDEIADILGAPTPKVKALVFQAREALMNRRLARDADCGAIREQLSVLRGGARRRGELRHHIAQCDACRAFDAEVLRQRAGMAVLLPVIPALALKESTLVAAFAAGGGGAAAAGGGAAAAGGAAGATAAGTAGTAVAGSAGGAAAGGAAAGGAAAGGAAAGGAAAGGAAAGGAAAAAGLSGSTILTGGAVIGAKVMGAKALTAFALTGLAGGGYAVVHELPKDPKPTPSIQAAGPQHTQPQKPDPRTPAGGVGLPVDSQECRKLPAGTPPPGGCAKKPTTDPSTSERTPGGPASDREQGDPDGDGVPTREDKCPKTAGNVNGCPAPGPGDPAPGGQTTPTEPPPDRDGDGMANNQDDCPGQFGTASGCPSGSTGADPTPPKRTPGDRDADGIPNAQDDDRDGDGVANAADACPNKAGTQTGCPVPAPVPDAGPSPTPQPGDRDGDGIPNAEDADRDGDGFVNTVDACPRKPGRGTEDGCPPSATGPNGDRDDDNIPNNQDDDRDGDQFLNKVDACPNKPAPESSDGCPVKDEPTTTVPTPATP
jgi:RNA polymerase sigma factor (sigma-70 family)